jgi:hypothetical protein
MLRGMLRICKVIIKAAAAAHICELAMLTISEMGHFNRRQRKGPALHIIAPITISF